MNTYNFVLSGGGARGFAHIGILKAFYEKGIFVNSISATSAGALIGALICDGFEPAEIEEILKKSELKLNINYTRFTESFLSNETIVKILKKNLRHHSFENLTKEFYVCVTDLNTGLPEYINEGKIIDAVMASSAIPFLFPPVYIHKIPYGDGGISNNLPIQPFLKSKRKTIGVNVNPIKAYKKETGFIMQYDRFIHLCINNNIRENIDKLDVYLEPKKLSNYHMLETKKFEEIIKIGYLEVKNNIELLKNNL